MELLDHGNLELYGIHLKQLYGSKIMPPQMDTFSCNAAGEMLTNFSASKSDEVWYGEQLAWVTTLVL